MASEAQQRHAALPSDKEHETCAHVDARVAADAADLPSTLDETTRTAKSYLRQLNVPRDLVLPSGWSMRDKCSCLEVSFDAYTVEYTCEDKGSGVRRCADPSLCVCSHRPQ